MCCNILILIYYIIIFNSYFVTYTAITIIYTIAIAWSFSECTSLITKLHSSLFLNNLKVNVTFALWRFSKQNHHNDEKLKIQLRYTLYVWFLLLLYTVFSMRANPQELLCPLLCDQERYLKNNLELEFWISCLKIWHPAVCILCDFFMQFL